MPENVLKDPIKYFSSIDPLLADKRHLRFNLRSLLFRRGLRAQTFDSKILVTWSHHQSATRDFITKDLKKPKKLQILELIWNDCIHNFVGLVSRFYAHFRGWKFTESTSTTVDGANIVRVDILGKENVTMVSLKFVNSLLE